jgi:hypothetical protein
MAVGGAEGTELAICGGFYGSEWRFLFGGGGGILLQFEGGNVAAEFDVFLDVLEEISDPQ